MNANTWGCDSDTGILRDVALRTPEHFRWFEANAVAKENLRKGVAFDPDLAAEQHKAFVAAFEAAGVTVHMTGQETPLQYSVYTRDPAIMTPWGVLIAQMYREQRRGGGTIVGSIMRPVFRSGIG